MIIRDPNTNLGAKVAGDGQLRVIAETLRIGTKETIDGNGYNINSGTVNLTTAGESGILYVRNTGINPLVINFLVFILGASTGGAGDAFLRAYRNPTAGTLISAGTPLSTAALNRNYGSTNVPTADLLVGAEGATVTASDGVNVQSIVTDSTRAPLDVGGVILPTTASIALTIQPPVGNTSMNVQCALELFELDENL